MNTRQIFKWVLFNIAAYANLAGAITFQIPLDGHWYVKSSTELLPQNNFCKGPQWKLEKGDLKRLYPDPFATDFIWYCTSFELSRTPRIDVALNLGVIGDLDIAYLDGKKIGSYGAMPPHAPVGIHHYRSYPIPRELLSPGLHTLEIRVYQTDAVSGGLLNGSKIGIIAARDSALRQWWFNFFRTDLVLACAIAMLLLGCYYGLVALTVRREKRFAYFFAVSMCACVYTAIFSYEFTEAIGNPLVETQIGFIGCIWGPHFIFEFMRELLQKPRGFQNRLSMLLAFLFTVLILASPHISVAQTIFGSWAPVMVWILSYTGYVCYTLIRDSQSTQNYVFLFAYIALLLTTIIDMVNSFVDPSRILTSPYGYFIFCVSLNGLMAKEHGYALADRRRKMILEKENVRLQALAEIDHLTQVFNKGAFAQRLETCISDSHFNQMALTLLVLDIDHFKKFNDSFGHPQGDLLLQQFTELLKEHVRPSDIVGRLGGEEFGIILPNTTEKEAVVLAERLRSQIEQSELLKRQEDGKPVTASFGVAELTSNITETIALYEYADEALYRAKKRRNCVVTYQQALSALKTKLTVVPTETSEKPTQA